MPKKKSENMKEYRVFLPLKLANEVDDLVDEGLYSSPSEAVRDIVRKWYREDK